MAIEVQFRRGTASGATSSNPILAEGEPGYEVDTNKMKIGDGISEWVDLPYFGGSGGGGIESIVAGTDISVDNTDPENPVVSFDGTIPTALASLTDDSTHRLVTDTEKSTWNAKQDAGAYLTGITVDSPLSGAGTPASHLTVDLSGKQDALGFTPEDSANRGQANGYAELDNTARLPMDELTYHNHNSGFEEEPVMHEGTGTYTADANECWFYDDATKDSMTLHTIPASGTFTPIDPVTGDSAVTYCCADRDTDTWVELSYLPTKTDVRYEVAFEVIKRSGSTNLHHQELFKLSHGELEMIYDCEVDTGKYRVAPSALRGLAVDTSLKITLGGGNVWTAGRIKNTLLAVTPATRMFKCSQVSGTWTQSSATDPTLDNTHYNNTGSGLVTMTDTYWAECWIYRGVESQDHMYGVYGIQEYATSALAQANKSIPETSILVSSHTIPVGRIIFQKSATTGIICESSFSTVFSASTSITSHGSLSGLANDDHTQYHNDTRGDARYVAKNTGITGATKTKITYDAKGLVTAGADATTADIPASTDKNYMTDAQITALHPQVVGGTPALTLGTANTAGTSPNFLRRDDTILAFDATAPSTQAFGDAAVVGVATVSARRDHKHAMMAAPAADSDATVTFTDITTNNVSTSKHGFFPKLPASTGKFLKDDMSWAAIAGGGDMLSTNNLSDVANAQTARNNILPSKTGKSLYELRVNAGETDYELVAPDSVGGIGIGVVHAISMGNFIN